MARLEAAVARHRRQESALLVLSVDLLFAAQYRCVAMCARAGVPVLVCVFVCVCVCVCVCVW
jgi:hypothetical protein